MSEMKKIGVLHDFVSGIKRVENMQFNMVYRGVQGFIVSVKCRR